MRRIAIAALAIVLAGCTSSDSTEPGVSLVGNYSLRTINGSNLPYTLSNGLVLTSDVLSLFNDGTYSDAAQYSDGRVGVENGFYSNNNGAITFTVSSSGATYAGSLSGSVLTEIIGTVTETYQKQ
jgi:hypothetical protein